MNNCGLDSCSTHFHVCRNCEDMSECRAMSDAECYAGWQGYCDACEALIAAGVI
jgi:hypothetical protein